MFIKDTLSKILKKQVTEWKMMFVTYITDRWLKPKTHFFLKKTPTNEKDNPTVKKKSK